MWKEVKAKIRKVNDWLKLLLSVYLLHEKQSWLIKIPDLLNIFQEMCKIQKI